MAKSRKLRSAEFKSKVALEACKSDKTINEIATEYEVHPGQVMHWKAQLKKGVKEIFSQGAQSKRKRGSAKEEDLYEQIGRLTYENAWLKKKL
jgi:transposase-like protein